MAYKKFYIRALEEAIKQKQQVNPRFSLRALAAKLEINSGTVSKILSGERIPTIEQAKKIVSILKFDQMHAKSFLKSVEIALANVGSVAKKEPKLIELGVEFIDLFDFNHFLVHTLISLKHTTHTVDSIAIKTNLTLKKVKVILSNLQNAGVINQNDDGSFNYVSRYTNSFKFPSGTNIRNLHKESIKYLLESIDNDWFADAVFATINLPIAKCNIAKYRTILYDFYDKVAALCDDETEDAESIYALGLYLFPLIK